MLNILRRIVQEVTSAENLDQSLKLVVSLLKQAMHVDVCSIYLILPGTSRLTLVATDGLHSGSIGRVSMSVNEGLVGLVAAGSEPLNVYNCPNHPAYKLFPGSGEERFRQFLGVPILHHRQTLGVLVTQQEGDSAFEDDHVALMVTLAAQLGGAIRGAEVSGELLARERFPRRDIEIKGIAGAPGVAVGTAVVIFPEADLDSVPDRVAESVEAERNRFRDAIRHTQEDMQALKERMGGLLPEEDQAVFDAYMLMLSGDSLMKGVMNKIEAGSWAPAALRTTIQDYIRNFDAMEDPYLRERASDIRDLGRRVLAHLVSAMPPRRDFPKDTILVGKDISAMQLVAIPLDNLTALVSTSGSHASHAAILARALGVPTVMGVADVPVNQIDGREIIVDGYQGRVYLQPSRRVKAEFQRLAHEDAELTRGLLEQACQPAVTPDGVTMPIYINSGLMADLVTSRKSTADGIGLYRTEVPFMIREHFPGEAEQTQIYQEVLATFPDKPVTLRTLDVGGDKALSYFPIREDNPFLGYRGIRISLDRPDVFITQLRAMLLANKATANLRILFPMISSLQELDEAMGLLAHASAELEVEGHYIPDPEVGVMIEVPAAVYIAGQLAERVDFLSIGTNDLIQYLLAVDRNNAQVAALYEELHPAVLQALKIIVDAGARAGKPVSVCGEMASDPVSALLLLGIGVDSLSVSLASLPRIKWVVRSFSRQYARALFDRATDLADPGEVRSLMRGALRAEGLGALVRSVNERE